MKKSISLLYIAIFILLIVNVVVLYFFHRYKITSEMSISVVLPYVQKYSFLKSDLEHNVEFVGDTVNDFDIRDLYGNQSSLGNLFPENQNLLVIARFSERYCSSCVKYMCDILRKIGNNVDIPLVYMFGYSKHSVFVNSVNEFDVSDEIVYNCSDFDTAIDYAGFPYLLFLDRNLNILRCYFPTKDAEQLDIENINLLFKSFETKYDYD